MYSEALLALLASSLVSAQTFTICDPLKKDCPPDPAVGGTETIDFTKGENSFFGVANGAKITYDGSKGAVFSIDGANDAPTITSPEYIFFGKLEVELQAAPGVGIVTSVVLQSDDLDEIDWEWVGGSPNNVQTNYFSKGDTTTYDRGAFHDVPNSMTQFHTYTIEWTKDATTWSINGAPVRTLTYADAKGGSTYPQTPMQVKVGTWVAGKAGNAEGTISWAGGLASFDNVPIQAFYKRIVVTDYAGGVTGAKSYVYGDKTGTWQSIKIDTENGALSPSDDGKKDDKDDNKNSGKDDNKDSGKDNNNTGGKSTDQESNAGANSTASVTAPRPSSTVPSGSSGNAASSTDLPGAAPKAGMAITGLAIISLALLFTLAL